MDSEKLIELLRGRHIYGRELHLSLPERIRAARHVTQAVVKVLSYRCGRKEVCGSMTYINHEGEVVLETETGELIQDKDKIQALAANWAADFDSRKNSRDAVHLAFSMPKG